MSVIDIDITRALLTTPAFRLNRIAMQTRGQTDGCAVQRGDRARLSFQARHVRGTDLGLPCVPDPGKVRACLPL